MSTPSVIGRLEAGETLRIVTYGTSLTAEFSPRFWRRSGGAWVRELRATLVRRFPGRVEVRNRAAWGKDSVWGLARLGRRVLRLRPDVLLLEFAANDADVRRGISRDLARANLELMIDRVREVSPACGVFAMTMSPPLGRHREVRPAIDDYYGIYRDVAASRNVGIIDVARRWDALDPQASERLIPDELHPGAAAGRQVILPAVLDAMSQDR